MRWTVRSWAVPLEEHAPQCWERTREWALALPFALDEYTGAGTWSQGPLAEPLPSPVAQMLRVLAYEVGADPGEAVDVRRIEVCRLPPGSPGEAPHQVHTPRLEVDLTDRWAPEWGGEEVLYALGTLVPERLLAPGSTQALLVPGGRVRGRLPTSAHASKVRTSLRIELGEDEGRRLIGPPACADAAPTGRRRAYLVDRRDTLGGQLGDNNKDVELAAHAPAAQWRVGWAAWTGRNAVWKVAAHDRDLAGRLLEGLAWADAIGAGADATAQWLKGELRRHRTRGCLRWWSQARTAALFRVTHARDEDRVRTEQDAIAALLAHPDPQRLLDEALRARVQDVTRTEKERDR